MNAIIKLRGAPAEMANETVASSDDDARVRALLSNDRTAFEAAVCEYHDSMMRLARALAGANHAEDVVQDAWLAVLGGLASFKGRSKLKTWILGIVANIACQCSRRERQRAQLGQQDTDPQVQRFDARGRWTNKPVLWHEDSPEALASSTELRGILEGVLEALPGNQRAAVLLREVDGLDLPSISRILDVSDTNARTLLHRGRRRLWQAVDVFQQAGEA